MTEMDERMAWWGHTSVPGVEPRTSRIGEQALTQTLTRAVSSLIIIIIIIIIIASHEDGMNDLYNYKSVHVMKRLCEMSEEF